MSSALETTTTSTTGGSTASSAGLTSDPSPPPTATGDESSGETTAGVPIPPPPATCDALKAIPSDVGAHIAEIEALGPNSWIPLGSPTPDPEFGSARGRSWGGQAFAAAPALRGAFFTGEGAHAYVKPDGYAMDDVWFYDLNAHAWVVIHPGNHIESFNQRVTDGDLSIDANGQLQDGGGDPVPLHVLIHAWDFVTYDTLTNRFAFVAGDGMGEYFMPGLETIQSGLDMLSAQRAAVEVQTMSPWFYSVEDCSWERYPVTTPTPLSSFDTFVYAEADEHYVLTGSQGAAVFDPVAQDWVVQADTGTRPSGYDNGGAYDSKRNRIYMGPGVSGSGVLFVYDVDTSLWTQPASSGSGPSGFGPNSAATFYDVANDLLVIFHFGTGVLYTWDPDTEVWASETLPDDVLQAAGYPQFSAFYDPPLNAYFVFVAGDSNDDGTMFAYRYAG